MIEDADPVRAEPRDIVLEMFTDFEGKNYYRATHKGTCGSMGSPEMREAYNIVNAELDQE
jgi:hypothetical protein